MLETHGRGASRTSARPPPRRREQIVPSLNQSQPFGNVARERSTESAQSAQSALRQQRSSGLRVRSSDPLAPAAASTRTSSAASSSLNIGSSSSSLAIGRTSLSPLRSHSDFSTRPLSASAAAQSRGGGAESSSTRRAEGQATSAAALHNGVDARPQRGGMSPARHRRLP
jgi:hypothetical protein